MRLRLALLGDSLADGQGAASVRDTLGPRLSDALTGDGHAVDHRVFAVRGARSSDLTRQAAAALRWRPDLAVVVVGANDVTRQVGLGAAARALGDAVRRLRHSGAEVVVAPAPDLSVVPALPATYRRVVRATSRRLRRLQVAAVQAAGGRVADVEAATMPRFADDHSLFSDDLFHPSSAGYAVIAAMLLPEVRDAAHAVTTKPHGVRESK